MELRAHRPYNQNFKVLCFRSNFRGVLNEFSLDIIWDYFYQFTFKNVVIDDFRMFQASSKVQDQFRPSFPNPSKSSLILPNFMVFVPNVS